MFTKPPPVPAPTGSDFSENKWSENHVRTQSSFSAKVLSRSFCMVAKQLKHRKKKGSSSYIHSIHSIHLCNACKFT